MKMQLQMYMSNGFALMTNFKDAQKLVPWLKNDKPQNFNINLIYSNDNKYLLFRLCDFLFYYYIIVFNSVKY